ncbi:metallophosphoesterase [Verrucosispora sp. WMMA2044]|uniref:Metallophosphoesterase n=1 Tax=Verrucosispora sioxanthis TaxID=2499994 RepID=A0A6M1L477_9ACTN|nr:MULTISPECIES: carbohydrate-binding domain-containing protein [Micromonospora]NEE63880.1 metallophosphoesterase [Verrucosispora sioxanthis]NGM12990.1 metallophosphoesterase [Verrucosispora sioxanthis]WBB50949.1 metallophosphoesterase [Verrucosispora sp. WMMA2044]
MRITRAIMAVVVVLSAGVPAGAAHAASPFTVVNGSIQAATGTPRPSSGTHATLWHNASYATIVVRGAGRLVVGAIGDHCDGWPTLRVRVGGALVGEVTVTSATDYGGYPVGAELPDGTHDVRIELVNDRYTGACDRNAHLASVWTQPPPAVDPRFTFAVVPDTQEEVLSARDTRLRQRVDWLVAQRTTLDLRFVTHSGDVVNYDTPDHAQYDRARAALRPLETAGLPYTLAVGNHDTQAAGPGGELRSPAGQLLRDTTVFNRYFTAGRFGAVGGQFEAGKVDNAYATYTAGGVRWLVLSLELWPRRAAVDWAKAVVAAHPRHNVVIVTHHHLESDASIGRSAGYGSTSPQYVFDNLVRRYPNIRFVFSGHTGTAASRVDTGVHGNRIYSFLQTFHSRSTNPVRLVEIDTTADSLRTWIYAPHTDEEFPAYERTYAGIGLVR